MFMKKLFCLFIVMAFALTSCERNETESVLQDEIKQVSNDENRRTRPVIIGEKINNPYSIKNMQAALDSLKAHPEQHTACMKAPSSTLDDIVIEPTDLYVRYLPADSLQYLQLMSDSTLILFDYPLDHLKIQTGDYYHDPTISGAYTWLYTSVPHDYQPHHGIQYEVIEELFLPEHSSYYSEESSPTHVKGNTQMKSGEKKHTDYADVLKTLEAVSFIITGNADKLHQPDTTSTNSGMQKAVSYVNKRFLGISWKEAVYNPEGYFKVATPIGNQPLVNVRIRVARYFTFYETRTNAKGYFYFSNQFAENSVSPNIEYFVYFDGKNGNNSWKLMNALGGTTYTSVGVHSPNRYDMVFQPHSDYWGKCIQQNTISNYINMVRSEGLNLPPSELRIRPEEESNYTCGIPLMVNHVNYGLMLTSADIKLPYRNISNDFFKISAAALNQLTLASLVAKMKSTKGTNWTTDYWKTFRNNDASPQQYGLVSGWAMHRENVLLYQFFGSVNTGYLDTSEAKRKKTTTLRDYINMFDDLRTIGCSNQSIEKVLCSKSVLQFRDDLIALYPNKNQQIKNIVQNIVGNITIVTYNLYRSFPHNTQSDRIPQFASIIKSCNPDLVAVQEIRDFANLLQLKNASGLEGERYNTLPFYGIGIMWHSRLGTPKITNKSISPSTNSTDVEKRAYIIAEFEDFYFISTHYSTDANERDKMSADIITFVKNTTKPVYIAGDLNATPNEQSIIYLTNNNFVLLNDINHKTYSVIAPSKLIDLILGYKKNSTSHSIVSRGIPVFPNEEMKSISDHFPYYVTVNIND